MITRVGRCSPAFAFTAALLLRRQGKRVLVRDLFGDEGWTDAANLR